MFRRKQVVAAALCGAVLAGCGSTVPAPTNHGQTSILPNTSPAQAYALVAQQIKACWFNPADPVLTRHIFRAEVPANRSASAQTNVIIYDKTPDGKRGLKTYSILFEQRRKGTVVTTENHKLPYALAQKLTSDVGYWIQGGANCGGPAPAASTVRGSYAPTRASTPPPRRGSY